jgi:hypothetical protein
MTEQTFIDLGFERNDIPMVESGDDHDFYYYTLDIGDICLMSDSDDVSKEKGWSCCIFDSETCEIKGAGDLEDLIRILKNNIK